MTRKGQAAGVAPGVASSLSFTEAAETPFGSEVTFPAATPGGSPAASI
jgi:hypothetical protein